jgi:hypothetical protein
VAVATTVVQEAIGRARSHTVGLVTSNATERTPVITESLNLPAAGWRFVGACRLSDSATQKARAGADHRL